MTSLLTIFAAGAALAINAHSFAETFGNDNAPWVIDSQSVTRIQAENYDTGGNGGAWFDDSLDNLGQQYRVAGPDIEATSDCSDGFNVGWISTGEWLQYTVQVEQAGTYQLVIRTSRKPQDDAFIRVSASPDAGSYIGTDGNSQNLIERFVIPHTNDWQVWRSNKNTIRLDEGIQTLQFEAIGNDRYNYNFNWFSLQLIDADITPVQSTPTPTPTPISTPIPIPNESPNLEGLHPDIINILDIPNEDIRRAPGGAGWADSYSVGDKCYCDTTFDHNIADILVDGPNGKITVRNACSLIGSGPGRNGRPIYNDVQCGNGPANDAGDEDWCPGRVDLGKDGCKQVGPTWKF